MSNIAYVLHAFWGPRRESSEACARRLAQMLSSLGEIHPAFGGWNIVSSPSGPETCVTRRFMPTSIDELSAAFQYGRFVTDTPGLEMPELGYSLTVSNDRTKDFAVSFRVHSGAYSNRPPEPNSVFSSLGVRRPGNQDVLNVRVLTKMLAAVAMPWEARWAVLDLWDNPYRARSADGFPLHPWAGWITYLCPQYARLISRPRSINSELTADGGLLLIATTEAFSIGNAGHVATAGVIQTALAPLQSIPRHRD